MAKKWIAALLVLAMTVQMLPVSALAAENATQTYTTGFTVQPAQDQMEKEFRKWASSVVDYYRSYSYADLIEGTNTARTTSIASYVLSGGKWKIDGNLTQINGSAFAPYYLAGQKKYEFDQSMDAAAQNAFGNVTRYTYYTDVDLYENPDKAQEIYEWLLIMTLKEKAELEPGFLTGTDNIVDSDKNGWYSFNVETGKMEYDSSLQAVQEMSDAQCKQSILKATVSLVEVAFEGLEAYQKIKGQTASIASKASSKLTKSVDMEQLKSDFFKELGSATVDAIADGLDELIEEEYTAIKNGLQNSIREYQACELSNAVLTANKNVIGYLKTTYINSDTMLDTVKGGYTTHTQGFRDAAQKIIGVLESERARGATEEEVRKALQDVALDMTGLKEVLPKSVIAYNMICKTLNGLASGVAKACQNYLKACVEQVISTKASKEMGEYWKILEAFLLTDLWDYVVKDGIVGGLQEGLGRHSPSEMGEDGNAVEFLGVVVTDVLLCIADKIKIDETATAYLKNCAINRGMEVVSIFVKQLCGDVIDQIQDSKKSTSTSGTQASTSGTQTSTSGTQTSTSGTQVSTSGTQTSTSGTQTSTSGTQTSTSGTQTSTSGTQTSTSGTQTSTNGTKASTSGTQVSTSGTQASTSGTSETKKTSIITTKSEPEKTASEKIREKVQKGEIFETAEVGIGQVVLSAILSMAQESLFSTDDKNSFTSQKLAAATFMSEADKSVFKGYMKDFDKIIKTFVNSTPTEDKVTTFISSLTAKWVTYCMWISDADERYEESVSDLLMWNGLMTWIPNIKLDFQKFSGIMKYYFSSGDFFKLVVKWLSGYDVEVSEENISLLLADNLSAGKEGEALNSEKTAGIIDTIMLATAFESQFEVLFGNLLFDIQEIASSVWDKCFELGGRIVVAKNDAENALTGENDASLMAIRLYVTYRNSELLYNSLRNCTIGNYRTKAYQNGGVNGLQYFIDGGGGAGSSTSNQLKMSINSREILDPILTPDLETIKALTDTILMQANLDYVGVGAYITLLENREKLSDTRFYKKYLNKGVLFTESYTEDCLIDVGELVQYQNTYDPNWDALFIH